MIVLVAVVAYCLAGAVAARMVAGHFAHSLRIVEWWFNGHREVPAWGFWPSLVAAILGLVWPLFFVALVGAVLPVPRVGAERQYLAKAQERRIRELEEELELR